MKNVIRFFSFFLALGLFAEAPVVGQRAVAGCHGGAVAYRGGYGGGYAYGGGGYYGGYRGAVNPAGRGYYGVGRFPLQPFATPLRPWGGLTPVRQFWFGRGRERRMNRRRVLFGGYGY